MARWSRKPTLRAIRDRFRVSVAFGIVLVSICAAAMVWRSSVAGDRASNNDQLARQEQVKRERIRTALAEQVHQDIRVFSQYEQARLLARELESDAREAGRPLARELRREAGSHATEARLFYRSIRSRPPRKLPSGRVVFDAAAAESSLRARDRDLDVLQPERLMDDAREDRKESVRLTGLAALFVAALVFLTLAEVAARSVSRWLAAAGTVTAASAFAIYLLGV